MRFCWVDDMWTKKSNHLVKWSIRERGGCVLYASRRFGDKCGRKFSNEHSSFQVYLCSDTIAWCLYDQERKPLDDTKHLCYNCHCLPEEEVKHCIAPDPTGSTFPPDWPILDI